MELSIKIYGFYDLWWWWSLFLLIMLIGNVQTNTFIWDPNNADNIEMVRPLSRQHTTFTNPPRCVKIPMNFTLCHGIRYSEMRLPNLLYHETLNEAIEQSSSWIQLIKIGCHPDTQLFLCSLFSPVCLDQTIPPCRSLCESVKQQCEPSMLRHGFSWPPMMQCNLFPIENNMCIESQQLTNGDGGDDNSQQHNNNEENDYNQSYPDRNHRTKPISNNSRNPEQQQPKNKTELNAFNRQLMDAICHSEWIIKMGLNNQLRDLNNPNNQLKPIQIRVKKFKKIYGPLNPDTITSPFILTFNRSMIISSGGDGQRKPKEKFVIIGKGLPNGGNENELTVKLVVSWLKNTSLIKKAIRKAKQNSGCKKYLASVSSNVTTTVTNNKQQQQQRARNRNNKKSLMMIGRKINQ